MLRPASLAFVLSLLLTALPLPVAHAGAWDGLPDGCVREGGVDVLFLLDVSGSMGGVLSSVKSQASGIMADLRANLTDVRFGASSLVDYPAAYSYPGYSASYGSGADYPWRLHQDLTTDDAATQAALDGIQLLFGDDWPESYSRALYEAGETVSWGPERLKLVVFFGDAEPHDLGFNGRNTGGDPGRDAVAGTADDLDFETVVAGLAARGVRVLGVNSGTAAPTMSYLAAQTGGAWASLGSTASMRAFVVDLVQDEVRQDAAAPQVRFDLPDGDGPPRLFVDGADAGPSPAATHAVARGDLPVQVAASDDCLVERIDLYADGLLLGSVPAASGSFTWPASAASPGVHRLVAVAEDWVGRTARVEMPVTVLRLDAGARALGAYAGVNVPASVELTAGGAQAMTAGGGSRSWDAGALAELASWNALNDTALASLTPDLAGSSQASSHVAEVSLLGGLVTAKGLRAVTASAFDGATLASSSSAEGSSVVDLRIAGVPVPVTTPNLDVPLPDGLGFVRVFEVVDGSSPVGAAQQVNMLHVFLDSPSLKGEIVVASARSAAGYLDASVVALERSVRDADDAGTDADAGDGAADATPLAPGTWSGTLGDLDRVDAYRFDAGEGDRIVLAVEAAPRVTAHSRAPPRAQPLDPNVAAQAQLRLVQMHLVDPTGAVRDSTAVYVGDRIEFNADEEGAWTAVLTLLNGGDANYTLHLSLPPVVFLPEMEGGLQGDAPGACADARAIDPALTRAAWATSGVMRAADLRDAYAVQVRIGDVVAVALKPDELDDGADFDLVVYDDECRLVAQSRLGRGLEGKGAPEAVALLPALRTGSYVLVVERIDGVGNYHLAFTSQTSVPTLPGNDAGSGRDSTSQADAVPVAPTGVYEGALEEGDASDWYVFAPQAGNRQNVALHSSAGSQLEVVLRDADGDVMGHSRTGLAPALLEFGTDGRPYYLEVRPLVGGGNYLLALAEEP